jgi:hypothetical protein
MIMTMNSVMMDGGRLVMERPFFTLLQNYIVALVATVADHKTADGDLQRFFEGGKSGSKNREQKKTPPGAGSSRLAALTGRPVNLSR